MRCVELNRIFNIFLANGADFKNTCAVKLSILKSGNTGGSVEFKQAKVCISGDLIRAGWLRAKPAASRGRYGRGSRGLDPHMAPQAPKSLE